MALGLKDTQANGLLNALFRSVSYSDPAAFWVKLHTNDPGSAGTTAAATETTRKQPTFSAAASGALTTTGDLVWTAVAANETYSHLSFWDDPTGGTFLGSCALTAPVVVTAGGTFTIATGDLDVALTPLAA